MTQPVATAEDAAFMADLLGEVDQNASMRRAPQPTRAIKSDTRRKTRVLSPPISDSKRKMTRNDAVFDDGYLPSTPPVEADMYDDGALRVMDDEDTPMSDQHLPSSPIVKAVQRKQQTAVKREDDEEEDLLEVAQAIGRASGASASVNISGSRPAPKPKAVAYPSPESSSPTQPAVEAFDASAWTNVTTKLNVLSSSPANETSSFGKLKPEDALESDGSLRMFWLDYTEINGSLCLFGKVKDRSSGNFVSCFLKIDNILRKLFFLPREHRQRECSNLAIEPTHADVRQAMAMTLPRRSR